MAKPKKTLLSSLLIVGALMGGATVAIAAPVRAPSTAIAMSQQVQRAHVTVIYGEKDVQIRETYAVSQETLRDEQIWQAEQQTTPSAQQLNAWLGSYGVLDRSDGAAIVLRSADGSTKEEYYRDGRLHRENGAAIIERNADGSTYEAYYSNGQLDRQDGPAAVGRSADGSTKQDYYRDGKRDREGGPAVIERNADGSTYEAYYRNDRLDRQDGPAVVRRSADGSTKEEYWRDDKLGREGGPAVVWRNADGSTVEPLSVIPGVTVESAIPLRSQSSRNRVAPMAPDAPGAHP